MNTVNNEDILLLSGRFTEQPIRIILLGVGGTGSEVLDGIVRIHTAIKALGHPYGLDVTVFDGDKVSHSNIGRQRFYEQDVGLNKAQVLVHRINLCFGLSWSYVGKDATTHDLRELIHSPSVLITCVDKAKVRYKIGKYFSKYQEGDGEYLWLDFGNGKDTGNVFIGHLIKPSERRYIPNVYDLYKTELGQIDDEEEPSCSLEIALSKQSLFVNRQCADLGLSLLWDLLTRGSLTVHGARFDLSQAMTHPYPINSAMNDYFGLPG